MFFSDIFKAALKHLQQSEQLRMLANNNAAAVPAFPSLQLPNPALAANLHHTITNNNAIANIFNTAFPLSNVLNASNANFTNAIQNASALDMANALNANALGVTNALNGGSTNDVAAGAPPSDMRSTKTKRPHESDAGPSSTNTSPEEGSKKKKRKPEQIYWCYKCNQRGYASSGNLKRHQTYECGKDPMFQCEDCDTKFQHRHSLKIHMKSSHQRDLEPVSKRNRNKNRSPNEQTEITAHNISLSPQLQIDDEITDHPESETALDNRHSSTHGGPSTSNASLLPNACFLPVPSTSNAGPLPVTSTTDEQPEMKAVRIPAIPTANRLPDLNALRLSTIATADVSVDVISREINVPYMRLGQQPHHSNQTTNAL